MADGHMGHERPFRWGSTAATAGGAALMLAVEQLDWNWPPLLVAGVLLFSALALTAAVVLWVRAAIAYFGRGSRRVPLFRRTWSLSFTADGIFPFQRLMPLGEAANKALAQADFARTVGKAIANNPVSYMALALIDDGRTPIFGFSDEWVSRPERIPANEFKSCSVSTDGNSLLRFGEAKPVYTDLAIAKRDFRRRLKEIKEWGNVARQAS
jgi:hypothetical protein